jgi:hypothetical protein
LEVFFASELSQSYSLFLDFFCGKLDDGSTHPSSIDIALDIIQERKFAPYSK